MSSYGKAYGAATCQTRGGLVVVQGLVTAKAWGHIATLPAGMRPDKQLIFSLNNHEQSVRVDVRTNGEIHFVAAPGAVSPGWISLTGITFAV